jgi:pyruvate formate lyase activating enzyme
MYPREANLYQKLSGKSVRCDLCEHRCVIENGEAGFCRARQNQNGVLKTLVYGYAILHKQTPIEKHNLYHYYPDTKTYAVGTPGCNFRCWWCASWRVARLPAPRFLEKVEEISPARIVNAAKMNGSRSITYTYTEPTVFFEYAYDVSRLARRKGLKNILTTNGFMSREMLEAFLPYLDAASVDLKTLRNKIYFLDREVHLKVILDNLKVLKAAGIWLEVSSMLIEGVNEDPLQLGEIARFIATELSPETPWHINHLYQPRDLHQRPAEQLESLRKAKQIGLSEGLKHVYITDLEGEDDTQCRVCGQVLIQRRGSQQLTLLNRNGECPRCWTQLAGVFEGEKNPMALVKYKRQLGETSKI